MPGVLGKKRSLGDHSEGSNKIRPAKRARQDEKSSPVTQSLLHHYYPEIRTLRKYLISKLPSSSRLRRKKIASLTPSTDASASAAAEAQNTTRQQLCALLDNTLVAPGQKTQQQQKQQQQQQPDDQRQRRTGSDSDDGRWEQWINYSQRGDDSYVSLSGGSQALFSQKDIVDFVIWLLFSRTSPAAPWPKHLLCDGFRKKSSYAQATVDIPGLSSVFPNHHVRQLKEAPWPQLLLLLGISGEKIMIDLLVDCAIFVPIQAGAGNLFQLSGVPLSELNTKPLGEPRHTQSLQPPKDTPPSEISVIRNRMLYARAMVNARGLVHFGLRHIHVLNRCPYLAPPSPDKASGDTRIPIITETTRKVMMYIFPRQFGLHNVFTSIVNRTQTAQKLQDYTLREDEIKALRRKQSSTEMSSRNHVPKRLRGEVIRLVERLQVRHGRCSYAELLRHYCPTPLDARSNKMVASTKPHTPADASELEGQRPFQGTQRPSNKAISRRKSAGKDRWRLKATMASQPPMQFESVTDLATPLSNVSTFCQAVLSKLIPDGFWGEGNKQSNNKRLIMAKVDHFVKLRRFESMSLREVAEGLKVTDMGWLAPPGLKSTKTSQTDMRKRLEILNEWLYYVFDSLLIPLLRSNFYVTESSTHRNKLFFFRHDVWRYVAEPSMSTLKLNMFEELGQRQATQILDSRKLGFSQVRLLPKGSSMRPIMNLRRRTITMGNKTILAPSINTILGPTYSIFRLEKNLQPSKLGASLFSVGDIYGRLKSFRSRLRSSQQPLYFAKLDVRSAFDTIPQDAVMRLLQDIPSEQSYQLTKYVEIKSPRTGLKKPMRLWQTEALSGNDKTTFTQRAEQRLAVGKKHTVFVDNAMVRTQDVNSVLAMVSSHIRQNLVRIGKKYYRQKDGIPQGSVLSSTLCNYFYADLERKHLAFLNSEDCLLLRLIDDFLLITPDVSKARRFVEVMHGGLPDYGVSVSPAKTLVNFDLTIRGEKVARLPEGERFPYCGTLIDCRTLDVGKNRLHLKDPVTANGLTVEYGRNPGQNFARKMLNAFKLQSLIMYYDTSHNAKDTVMRNVFEAFAEAAMKMWAYARCLPRPQQPTLAVIIDAVKNLLDAAYKLLTGTTRKAKHPGYAFELNKTQVSWLGLVAIRKTLLRKQTAFGGLITWLEVELKRLESRKGIKDLGTMLKVAEGSCGY